MAFKTLTASVAVGLTLAAAAGAETHVVYGSWAPANDPASLAMEKFIADVEERSGGAATFETHFDSSVVAMRTVLAGLGDNLVDAAYIAGSVYQAELPIESMVTIYSTIEGNPWSMSGAMNELMLEECTECSQQYDDFGIVPLAYGATPHFYLMCRKPIGGFADLEGKSIRAASGNLSFPQAIGAVPVSTPTVEVFEAMQRGQVECAVGSIFWLQAYSLWDVVKYVLELPFGQYNNGLIFAANEDFWNDIPDEDRKAIVQSLPTLVAEVAAIGSQKAEEVKAESIEKGVTWAEPTPEMTETLNAWFDTKRAETEAWGAEKSIPDPGTILDQMEALVTKWNEKVEGLDGDQEKFRQMLVDEVFGAL